MSGAGRVAPRAGAWIETKIKIEKINDRKRSHPVRVRGLKPKEEPKPNPEREVAPRAGAWIETSSRAGILTAAATPLRF